MRCIHRLAAALCVLSAAPVFADNVRGTWSSVVNWPLISVHAALTADGRVLTYGTDGNGKQTGYFIYDVWDPSAGPSAGHLTLPNQTLTDLFCSSQLILPQSGNIIISGGDNLVNGNTTNTGNNNSNVFNVSNNTLARGNNMNRARWYSSSTVLVNGEIYIQGGSGGGDRPEIRDANGVYRLLTGADTSGLVSNYPRNFVAPDGRVFGFDTAGRMYYVTTSGNGSVAMAGQLPGSTSWTSSAAMFRPGRILQMGGASSAALVVDITGATPTATPTQSMSTQRQWVSATMLADGRVLATGGSQVDNQLTGVNNVAEIWNPANGTWTQGNAAVRARLYHSTGLLLPDATVLVSGGGAPGPQVNLNAEIYYPPYLYNASGGFAARPSIVLAPDVIEIGETFSVGFSNASSISRVALIKTGSMTHSWNMDQRFIELPFTASGAMLDVQAPARASDATPGYYLLFLLNAQGVPSIAKMVRINIAANPNPNVNYTPAVGGAGGSPFQLACESGEVLAGVYGRSGTLVNQVGLRCIRIDENGAWIGTPTDRGASGTATGTAFTKTCPTNFAISGFRGRAGQFVDQLDFQCRALTATGKVTGAVQYLGAVGGTGGTAQGPFSCSTDNPGYAMYGRSGSSIDNFGILCRQATLTPTNDPPVIVNPGTQTGSVGVAVDITIGATDPEGDPITFSATGLPPNLSINSGTGRITGTPTTAGNFPSTITASDLTGSDTANVTWNISAAPFVLNPLPPSPAAQASTQVTFTASTSGGSNVRYKWYFDDGTPETAYSASPSVNHTFANPGIYYVTVTAIADGATEQAQTVVQTIHLPATANRPSNSSNIAYERRVTGNGRLWVVNQDNDSVTAFDAVTRAKLAEIAVGASPRTLAVAPDGRIWVTNKAAASISVINPDTLAVVQTINLPFASQPYGIAFAPTGGFAFVVLEASAALFKLDASTGAQVGAVAVGLNPRHVAVNADGTQVFVSRFVTPPLPGEGTGSVQTQVGGVDVGGELIVVNASSMGVLQTIVLRHSNDADFENQGSGVPNYLGATVISPDGASAWVPSKKDNIRRGMLRNGQNLNFQNTVRAISSRIDLNSRTEDFAARLDHDNSSVASAVAFDRNGVYAFVALETSREVAVVDGHGAWEIFRFDAGRAPQGLALSPDGLTLFVNNFMDRTVGVYDLTPLVIRGESNVPAIATLQAVTNELLTTKVFKGKQLFYDARDTRLARDAYLSCASCHNDGGQDGRVWDLTGMGEGLRNTVNLQGRAAGQGFLHWSGNFDELQDFEAQIRNLSGGTGLMSNAQFNTGTRNQPLGDPKSGISTDLDRLAAYVASLKTFASSPHRNGDGTLTASAAAGKQIFADANCAQCHSGAAFTESGAATLRDIGTLKPSSGQRLGGPLSGIDTPTLRDVWATAPYLHDGSAATLTDAIRAHNGVSLSDSDVAQLVSYLQQIGGQEPSAPLPSGTGAGLTGRYFNNSTLGGQPVLVRNEAVNFGWGTGSPGTGINADGFSVRWSGQVEATVTGTHRFRTVSDEGVRLWVNGVQVINNWTAHTSTADTSPAITLSAGQRYTIIMEYFEGTGSALARLRWKVPGGSYVAIPQERLYGD